MELRPHAQVVAGSADQSSVEDLDGMSVAWCARRHHDDDPFQQLDALVHVEDAGLEHAVVLGDRDRPRLVYELKRDAGGQGRRRRTKDEGYLAPLRR